MLVIYSVTNPLTTHIRGYIIGYMSHKQNDKIIDYLKDFDDVDFVNQQLDEQEKLEIENIRSLLQ